MRGPQAERATAQGSPRGKAPRLVLERETGIEPATNSLEGCDSTTELLPPSRLACFAYSPLRRDKPAAIRILPQPPPAAVASSPKTRCAGLLANWSSRSPARLDDGTSMSPVGLLTEARGRRLACQPKLAERAKVGGEGRIRTSEAAWATDLQSAAFDRFATSPIPRLHVSVAGQAPATDG